MSRIVESLVIRADADRQIGMGHFMRCLALAQAWKDTGGQVVFITACQSESLLQRLKEEGFDIHLLARSYPDDDDWEHTKNILAAYPSAWVVLDGYHFDEVYQQQVKEFGQWLLVIDDMAHLKHYYADIVLNQNLHADQLRYTCEPYTRLLLGTKYVLLRKEFLAWRDWKREVPEVARQVLVTLGGADPENHTLKVIQGLDKVEVTGLEVTIVIGASNPHRDVLEAATKQSRIPIRLIWDVTNMPELMTWADVAVSSAGSTVWELLFLGTPTLALILADNQCYIAEQVVESGVGQSLGWARNISAKSLAKAITLLLKDFNLREGKQRRSANNRWPRFPESDIYYAR
jgi:UDP-2,4-diacetamido-2,4,6-trideoxy-beta-L-altropyranose hydrolase